MATTPPPYDAITGITRAAMKDNAQETIGAYNGNARPGELVVDQLTDNLYVGNTDGNLTLVGPNLAQVATNSNVTLSITNQNGHIYADDINIYVPNDSQVALPIGYAVTIVTNGFSSYVRPNDEGVTRIYVSGQTGSYVENDYDNIEIPQWSMATILKIEADVWMIAGAGLTENYC